MRAPTPWPLALLLLACAPAADSAPAARDRSGGPPPATPGAAEVGVVAVHTANAAPQVATDLVDHHGAPVGVACAVCHSVKEPNAALRHGAGLERFHQGLVTAHGDLTCLSCHDARDYGRLRLADLTPVGYPDVMTLCRQCHGPQARDWERGVHGGMTGYWDMTRGGRDRNGCTTCHDPHAPKIPRVIPARGPIDRVVLGPHAPHDPAHEAPHHE